ncbi:beta-soluble NSF attachment protein-like [Stegodyphus dumicola]|uniref:beta-soluble NSF attachment protein-like n=1 Tax=Stegodyphus dumicola TaxID=202533 RepID=UPI0015AB0CA1|nr:beta-soluble NSF attachment protein-like [Stegodyphus dumicola]
MADQQRSKGEDLMMEAEKKLNVSGGACCGRGGRAHVEEACDLYVKAANAFKMAKDWQKAGNAFAEAAALQLENERKNEAGMNYVEAAKCYKKVNPKDCEQCLIKASEVYSDVGRGKTAGKQHMTLAELHEEQGNLEKALEEYQTAADLFTGEEMVSSTTKCLLNVATHSATLGDLQRAEEIFEKLGNESFSNKLLKYTACENFSKAGLCRLTRNPQDGDGLIQKVMEWQEASPAFGESREFTWLIRMAEAAKNEDVDAFNEAIRSYESIKRLTDWENNLLKKVRKNLGPDLR